MFKIAASAVTGKYDVLYKSDNKPYVKSLPDKETALAVAAGAIAQKCGPLPVDASTIEGA